MRILMQRVLKLVYRLLFVGSLWAVAKVSAGVDARRAGPSQVGDVSRFNRYASPSLRLLTARAANVAYMLRFRGISHVYDCSTSSTTHGRSIKRRSTARYALLTPVFLENCDRHH